MKDQNQPNSTPKQPRVFLAAPAQTESEGTQQDPTLDTSQDSHDQQPAVPSDTSSKKVIQPSDSFVAEMHTTEVTASAEGPAQRLDPPSVHPGLTTDTSTSQAPADRTTPGATQPTRPDTSLIYPEATNGTNSNSAGYSAPAPPINGPKSAPHIYTFDEGYVIGGTVFFYQFFAGIVFGLVSGFILRSISTTIVLAIIYLVEYLTLLYLPYRVLQSNAVEDPLWLTLIGAASQTVIIVAGFALIEITVKAVGGLGVFGIVIGIGFLVASYFLTKLAWGIAFSFVGIVKNKLMIKVIGIGLIAIFMGGIVYHFVPQRSAGASLSPDTSSTSIQAVGLSSYHIAGSPSFSVSFYKGSKEMTGYDGSGELMFKAGPGLNSVSISVANGPPINAQTPTYCYKSGVKTQFSFTNQGSNGFVCTSRNNNLTSYTGHIQEHGKSYTINMFAWSQQQKLATVKAIFNSIVIE